MQTPDHQNAQAMQKMLFHGHRQNHLTGLPLPHFRDAGFRIYSQTDEDGILLYIFSIIGFTNKTLIDFAFGDPHGANTTNLLLNWGFWGLLVEGSEEGIRRSTDYFANHPDTRIFPPKLERHWITAENVNQIIYQNRIQGEIDLFSLDIDGVDYWLWKALTVVSPRVVVVEANTCLGRDLSVTVPYRPDFNRHDINPNYFGASVQAFTKLGKEKGYRLVACNRFGYNLFFIRNDLGKDVFPEITPHECFNFEPFALMQSRQERLRSIMSLQWVTID